MASESSCSTPARSPKPDAERALGARRVELEELLRRSDVISLHAPASPATTT